MATVVQNVTSLSEAAAVTAGGGGTPNMKGPHSSKGRRPGSNRPPLGAMNNDDCSLPGTPKIYDVVRPAAADDDAASLTKQQERILRFGHMLERFKSDKGESPGGLRGDGRGPVDGLLWSGDVRGRWSSAHSDEGDYDDVQIATLGDESPAAQGVARPTLEPTPAKPITRGTLAEHPNELKRTPLGLSRHRAWRLSGIEPSPAKMGAEPVYASAAPSPSPSPAAAEPKMVRFEYAPGSAPTPTAEQQRFVTPEPSDDVVQVYVTPPAHDAEPTYIEMAPDGKTPYHLAAAGDPLPTPHTAKFGFTATPGTRLRRVQGEYVDVHTPGTGAALEYLDIVDGKASPYAQIDPADCEEGAAGRELQPEEIKQFRHAASGELQFLVESVEDAGVDINAADVSGRSTLMYTLQYSQIECAEWLLAKGADPNMRDESGSTALHYAAQTNNYHALKLLLKNGADFKALDDEARSPLHWAMRSTHPKIVAKLTGLVGEAGVNAADIGGMTPLMWAAYYGQAAHMAKLREAGALAEVEDKTGRTALHWALFSGVLDCVKLLLTYERTFAQDASGKSAIHFAAETGFNKAVAMLLKARPQSVHDIDVNGRTPLHWAAACKHAATAAQLLKSGAHPTRIDSQSQTPNDYAKSVGASKVCDVLAQFDQENATQPRLGPAGASTSIKSFESEGAMSEMDDIARYMLHQLAAGSQLGKYAHGGKGPLQKRFFWLDCFTGELCWTKSVASVAKDPKAASSAFLVEIRPGASDRIMARADFDPVLKHKYAFELVCEGRSLDLVAPSEKVLNLWVDGLQMLKDYAIHVLEERTASGASSN